MNRKTLPITEALEKQSVNGIDAAGVLERELRKMVDSLKAELTEEIAELRQIARVLADQAADRDRPADEKPLMDLKEVKDLTGYSESTIQRRIDAGEFPPPITEKGKKKKWLRRDVMKAIQGGW